MKKKRENEDKDGKSGLYKTVSLHEKRSGLDCRMCSKAEYEGIYLYAVSSAEGVKDPDAAGSTELAEGTKIL